MLHLKVGDKIETPLGIGLVSDVRSDLTWVRVIHGGRADWFRAEECLPA